MPRGMSTWLLSISKAGDSTISLGNLFPCSVTLRVKRCYLMFWQCLLFFFLCLFSCHWASMKIAHLWPLCTLSWGIYMNLWDPPHHSFLQTKQSQLSQHFCVGQMLHHLSGPLFDSSAHACLPCTGFPRTGHSTAGVASAVLNREEGSPPSSIPYVMI